MRVFRGKREGNYFCGQDWTGRNTLIWLRKSGGARRAIDGGLDENLVLVGL
jgi:hypothetical protein